MVFQKRKKKNDRNFSICSQIQREHVYRGIHTNSLHAPYDCLLVCVTLATNTSTHPCTDIELFITDLYCAFVFSSFSSICRLSCTASIHIYFYFCFVSLPTHFTEFFFSVALVIDVGRYEQTNQMHFYLYLYIM